MHTGRDTLHLEVVIVDKLSKKVFTKPTWTTSGAKLAAKLFAKHMALMCRVNALCREDTTDAAR
eukprot:SAG22_NODE_16353_length_327_cov_0.675439_1_plen_63_part_10